MQPQSPIGLIAIDLDGTLLGPKGNVSPRNVAAIRTARSLGWAVVIATGRALIESLHAVESIEHDGLFIGAGGALLSDIESKQTLRRSAMSKHFSHRIATTLNAHGHMAHLLKDADVVGYDYAIIGEHALDPATEWWFQTFPVRAKIFERLEDDPHPDETVRVGTVATAGELSHIASELRDDLGDSIFLQHWASVTQWSKTSTPTETHLLEAFNPEVDKWTMLEYLAAIMRLGKGQVVAIGDGLNDLQMLREAGIGIAMANANASVQHVADMITKSNVEDGVAHAIDMLIADKLPSPHIAKSK